MNDQNEFDKLLENIKGKLPKLQKLLDTANGLTYEDGIYRYYHKSAKVYYIQELTEEIAIALAELCPHDRDPFCDEFQVIYNEGTCWEYDAKVHKTKTEGARQVLEAFLHAKYFLEMAVKYGKLLEKAPLNLPSGWAALSKLYRIKA